jgi:hypothetical protein
LSDADLTPGEARATTSESGYGVTLDGLHAYWPGIPCYVCGKFVGRDGHVGVEHFEMSSEIASVEGICRRCIDAA